MEEMREEHPARIATKRRRLPRLAAPATGITSDQSLAERGRSIESTGGLSFNICKVKNKN